MFNVRVSLTVRVCVRVIKVAILSSIILRRSVRQHKHVKLCIRRNGYSSVTCQISREKASRRLRFDAISVTRGCVGVKGVRRCRWRR